MPATVTVGSKLPWPLIIHLFDKNGEKKTVTLNGVSQEPGKMQPLARGGRENSAVSSGFRHSFMRGASALTHNVDAEFWAEWSKQYKEAPYLANGLVYAHNQAASVEAMAVDKTDLRTGLEGLDGAAPAPGIKPLENPPGSM
jgi:hypothetical protein